MNKTLTDKKLTLKQRKWLKLYIETGNATEAARRAYDCNEDSARNIGSENVAKLHVRELMEDMGLSMPRLLSKLDEGLDANKQLAARANGRDANAETDDFIEVPDFLARHKYLETALKLNRTLGPEVQTNNQFNAQEMNIEIT